jgi:DNA-binding CsgD family transcriptional regulator
MSARPERSPEEPAPSSEETPELGPELRVLQMAALRRRGFGLHQIAELFLVSRERVRQLLLAHGGPDRHDAAAARRRGAERLAEERADDVLDRWRTGESAKEIALALGLDGSAARNVIERLATEADRYARQAGLAARRDGLTYTDAEIIRALQAAATILGRVPAAREYAALAGEMDLPSLATVANRMRGWSNAVAAAGLRPTTGNVRSHPRRWTPEACWEALGRAVDELGEIPTVVAYEQFAAGRDDLPSAATIRNRLGRWSALTARLAAEAADGAGQSR